MFRAASQISLNSIWNRFPTVRLHDPDPEARILSRLVKSDFFKSQNVRYIAPGSTLFRNHCGGTVAVTARCVALKCLQLYMLTPRIKDFLLRLLRRLASDLFHFSVMNDQEFLPGNSVWDPENIS